MNFAKISVGFTNIETKSFLFSFEVGELITGKIYLFLSVILWQPENDLFVGTNTNSTTGNSHRLAK